MFWLRNKKIIFWYALLTLKACKNSDMLIIVLNFKLHVHKQFNSIIFDAWTDVIKIIFYACLRLRMGNLTKIDLVITAHIFFKGGGGGGGGGKTHPIFVLKVQ